MTGSNLERQQKNRAECPSPGLLSRMGFAKPPFPGMAGEGKINTQTSMQHDGKWGLHKHKGVHTQEPPKVSLFSLGGKRYSFCSDPERLCPGGQMAGGKRFAGSISAKQVARLQGRSMDLPCAQGRSPRLSATCLG